MTLDKQAVERVARAIYETRLSCEPWKRLQPELQDSYRTKARAAIAALVPQEEEVGRMVERLRVQCERAEREEALLAAPDGTVAVRISDLRGLLERLVGIQGK